MGTLEERIERLERSNLRYRIGLWAVCFALAGLLTAGFAAQPETEPRERAEVAEVIRARRIQVVNEANQPIVDLSTLNGNGSVTTYDATGDILVLLGITTQNQGAVATFDGDGNLLVEAGANASGGGRVRTFSAEGNRSGSLP